MNMQAISQTLPNPAAVPATGNTERARMPAPTDRTTDTSSPSASNTQAPNRDEVKAAAEKATEFVKRLNDSPNSSLQFEVNDDIGKMVVKVVDTQTKEVIRQIPTEEMVQIAKTLDKLQGMLIKSSA